MMNTMISEELHLSLNVDSCLFSDISATFSVLHLDCLQLKHGGYFGLVFAVRLLWVERLVTLILSVENYTS